MILSTIAACQFQEDVYELVYSDQFHPRFNNCTWSLLKVGEGQVDFVYLADLFDYVCHHLSEAVLAAFRKQMGHENWSEPWRR